MSKVMNVPDGWEVKYLKDVGSCKNGLTYSPDDIVESGGLLVLRSSNIQENKLAFRDNVFVRNDKKVNYKVQVNDILICVRNGSKNLIGKNALITEEAEYMAHGAFMTVFHSKNNHYIFQLFQSDMYFQQVEKNLGATINSINNSDLLLFEFPFPKEKNEQQKIAKILSTLDKTIESTQELIDKEKNIKKGLMHDLLTNGIDQNGKIRTPQTHEYKESELGMIPTQWEVLTLNKCSIITNSNVDKKYLPEETEVQLCNYMDVYSNDEVNNTIDFMIASATNLEIKKFSLKKDDVIITKDSESPDDIAIPTYIAEDLPNVLCGYHLTLIRLKKNCDGKYLSLLLQSNYHKRYFGSLASGSTRFALSLGAISNTLISLPTKDEQHQIAKILTTQDRKIETEEQNLAKLKELKKGLMSDLLSGDVRVRI